MSHTILHCVTLHYAHATHVAHVSRRSNARMPVDCLCQAVPAMTKTRGPPLGCSLQREGACRLVHALRALCSLSHSLQSAAGSCTPSPPNWTLASAMAIR